MMDIRDINGDKLENYITLAVIFGKTKMTMATILFFILSDIFVLIYSL
jgi:4-hydroxybenzoate polyprenyltransferase